MIRSLPDFSKREEPCQRSRVKCSYSCIKRAFSRSTSCQSPRSMPGANLGRGLALLRLLVGVDGFLHAGGAGRSVRSFKAAMQAVVSHHPVAMAVAGLLMQYGGNLCRHLVGGDLVGMGEVDAGKLISAKDGGRGLPGSGGVVGRNVVGGVGPLGGCDHSYKPKSHTSKYSLHAPIINPAFGIESKLDEGEKCDWAE